MFHQLRLRLAKLFEQVSSLADDGSIKSNLKARGTIVLHEITLSFISGSNLLFAFGPSVFPRFSDEGGYRDVWYLYVLFRRRWGYVEDYTPPLPRQAYFEEHRPPLQRS